MGLISRRGALAGLAFTASSGCARAQTGLPTQALSGLRIVNADYAAARQAFQTRLLRRTGSPQNYPSAKPSAGIEEIVFLSGDLQLRAWVAKPADAAAPLPLVVFLHGGFAFGPEDMDMARPYVEAGYAVVIPWVRGENGQAGAFSMFYDEVADAMAVTDFMRTRPDIDAARIYVAGHSVGGTLAMLVGLASTNYRAICAFSGSPDQLAFCTDPGWSNIVPFDTSNAAEFEMRSPLSYAASFKAPARLFHARGEVYGADTRLMAQIAQAAGQDVEAIAAAGDHFTAVAAAMPQSIAFFRAHA